MPPELVQPQTLHIVAKRLQPCFVGHRRGMGSIREPSIVIPMVLTSGQFPIRRHNRPMIE
jgi:hypothetical protein